VRIRGWRASTTLVAASFFAAQLLAAQEHRPVDALVDASAERLELAREVALAKWDSGGAVEDPARERQVLDGATAAGVRAGLPSELVMRFFSAQIEANKLVQYALLAEWQRQGNAPPHQPINLARDVRPKIDRIQELLIAALAERSKPPTRSACRKEYGTAIDQRSRSHFGISGDLFSTGLDRALGSLCDEMQ
jgi:chorismate mutase